MKELSMSRESSTFTSALKGIRNNPSLGSSSHKTSRSNETGFLQKSSFSHLYSPRINITRRKNLTLKQLFFEYESNPNTQYVIRLKKQPSTKNDCAAFDNWIANLNNSNNQSTCKQPNIKYQQKLIFQNKVDYREQLKHQISEKLTKMNQKLDKKSSQTTQQSRREETTPLNRQIKYSFSDYFSQFSELQTRDAFRQAETITKVSIGNEQKCGDLSSAQNCRQCPKKMSQNMNDHSKSKASARHNKQNIEKNGNEIVNNNKIVGLQFSKNKRFKSTKKKRKADS